MERPRKLALSKLKEKILSGEAMQKISNADDVYQSMVAESEENWDEGDNWLLGLVAFATIEEDRFEWSKHFEEINKISPSSDEIRNWYEQLPHGKLLDARGRASNALRNYADDILEEASEKDRKEIETGIIVSTIQRANRFGPQLATNVLGGFVAALLFSLVVIIFYFTARYDISSIDAINGVIEQNIESKDNGKETSE